jgi:hypothetical protein
VEADSNVTCVCTRKAQHVVFLHTSFKKASSYTKCHVSEMTSRVRTWPVTVPASQSARHSAPVSPLPAPGCHETPGAYVDLSGQLLRNFVCNEALKFSQRWLCFLGSYDMCYGRKDRLSGRNTASTFRVELRLLRNVAALRALLHSSN